MPKQLFHYKRCFKVSVISCNNNIMLCLKACNSNNLRYLMANLIEQIYGNPFCVWYLLRTVSFSVYSGGGVDKVRESFPLLSLKDNSNNYG